ncbi:hypothetical protein [Nitrospira tepida]|uniref:hypothetical protein n=1 Tax=Nitrospira tepida TaxID=2973512 RepID=UPI00259CC9CB|nr:hypothetical protein [Nitrospira tepida]
MADTGHHRLLGWRTCPTANDAEADWVIGQPDFLSEGRNAKRLPGPTTLNVPTGIVAYGTGLAVADAWNHRVLIWRQLPTTSHCPPDLVLGQKNFEDVEINRGCAAPSAETLYWPYGVCCWGDSLIVADTGNRRVLIWFTPPTQNGQAADLVLGQTDFAGKDENAGGAPSARSMRWPHGIARWGNKLCVADAGNNRVMIWNTLPSTCGAESDWILGQTDVAQVDHNGGQYWPHAGSLNMPYGIASAGDWLVVSDTANSRLLGWHVRDLGTGARARALAGQRSFEMKGDNQWGFPTPDTICWPYGVSVCEGMLAIADSGNNRVVIRPMCVEELE